MIVHTCQYMLKKTPHRIPALPVCQRDLDALHDDWIRFVFPSEFDEWPRMDADCIQTILRRIFGIHLKPTYKKWMDEHYPGKWTSDQHVHTRQECDDRSLIKLFGMPSLWQTKAMFSVIVTCRSCQLQWIQGLRLAPCNHRHIMTIRTNGTQEGIEVSDQLDTNTAGSFATRFYDYFVVDVFKAFQRSLKKPSS
jgi:hypothetical protein